MPKQAVIPVIKLDRGDDDLFDGDTKLWTHGGAKFTLGTIDGEPITIAAQYNPKELAFSTSATWNAHANPFHAKPGRGCRSFYEYGSTDSRTLTVELLFDSYEERSDPKNSNSFVSIEPLVAQLEALVVPIDPSSSHTYNRRPQLCVAVWGGARPFRCIVQSVATKVTMMSKNGDHQRAICTVTLKEVDAVAMLAQDRERHDDQMMDKLDARVRARSTKERRKRDPRWE
jgi:hypothetical protein